MNRRDFLFNALSGLFVASSPKIIIDLAANTYKQPVLLGSESLGFYYGNALVKKAWEVLLFKQVMMESYFSEFMGDTDETIVVSRFSS